MRCVLFILRYMRDLESLHWKTMVSQCPVIASDINVFHEIYNKAVLYVNPTDEEQISDVIRLLINDEKLQRKLVDLGENSHNYIHGKKVH